MSYTLGQKSRQELTGVHQHLVLVVERAIQLTTQDFAVHDGIRTVEEQRELVVRGVSWTMQSKHLRQPDGFGHAVDLVPFINGKLRWEWPPVFVIADAVRRAAHELGARIRWGGHWSELTGTTLPPESLVANYVEDRRRANKRASIDGPHFELIQP